MEVKETFVNRRLPVHPGQALDIRAAGTIRHSQHCRCTARTRVNPGKLTHARGYIRINKYIWMETHR